MVSDEKRADQKGVKLLGRDRLDPKAADCTAILTKIKAMNPDALYYGGISQAGIKLARQAHGMIPKAIKRGRDGMYSAEMLSAAGFPAAEGWYATIASRHDLQHRTISVFRIRKDPNHAADDMVHQYRYIGVAPQS